MAEAGGLLEGLRVLDCSLWQPGQYAAQLLCDLGAEVIKVEPPGGDRMRGLADRFFTVNSHKRSVVADLKTEAGVARVLELADEAEVLIECFRTGVAVRLGIGFEQLSARNPALVYCSISGYGQVGPLAAGTGHDLNFQAMAGALSVVGGQPVASGLLAADQGGGMAAAFGILAAVLRARRTGEGEHVDVAMTDVLASWVAPSGSIDPSRPMPSHHAAGYGIFELVDGHVALGVFSEDRLWAALVTSIGLAELAELDFPSRADRSVELNEQISQAIAGRRRDELVAELGALGVPASPVLSREEVLVQPQFLERGLFTTAPDGTRALAHPVRYERHPARPPGLPPALGELAEGGFSSR